MERLKVYEGVPPPFDRKQKVVVPSALRVLRLKPGRKFCTIKVSPLPHLCSLDPQSSDRELTRTPLSLSPSLPPCAPAASLPRGRLVVPRRCRPPRGEAQGQGRRVLRAQGRRAEGQHGRAQGRRQRRPDPGEACRPRLLSASSGSSDGVRAGPTRGGNRRASVTERDERGVVASPVEERPPRVLLCVLEGLECHPRPTDRLVCVVLAACVSLSLSSTCGSVRESGAFSCLTRSGCGSLRVYCKLGGLPRCSTA